MFWNYKTTGHTVTCIFHSTCTVWLDCKRLVCLNFVENKTDALIIDYKLLSCIWLFFFFSFSVLFFFPDPASPLSSMFCLLFLDEWKKKLLSFTHLSAQLSGCSWSALLCCWLLLHTLMPSSVAVLHCIGYMRLLSRLLGQLRRMAPCRNGDRGSHGLPYSSWGRSVTVDSLSAGRRSLLCRGAPPGPVWVLLPHCPARSSSFDSFCSSSHKSTAGKMSSSTSSSSSANNEQGKPKPTSPFRKRGSLQSTTSPGECGSQGGLREMMSELSNVVAEQRSATVSWLWDVWVLRANGKCDLMQLCVAA